MIPVWMIVLVFLITIVIGAIVGILSTLYAVRYLFWKIVNLLSDPDDY